MGIVNGTTNYILTQMTEEGASYAEALAEAQSLGLRRARPHRRRRGLRRRRQGGDHRHASRSAPRSSPATSTTRASRRITEATSRSPGGSATSSSCSRSPSRPTTARSACGCTRRWSRSTHPLAVGARQLQRRVRRGRGGRRPHVLRPRRRRRPRPASAVLGDLIDAAVNLRKGSHASRRASCAKAAHPPDRRRSSPRTT